VPRRLQSHVLQVIDDACVLIFAWLVIPGIEMDGIGFVEALLVMSGVWIALGLFLDRANDRKRRGLPWHGRVLSGMLVSLPLLVFTPAVADLLVPGFDITSVGAYAAFVAVWWLSLAITWRIVTVFARAGGRPRT
jgi:hypothetical protein